MAVLSLTDFISLKRRPTVGAKGVKTTRGGCLCGKISFEFTGEAVKTLLCHCTNCKRLTGTSHSTNITIPALSLRFVGSPRQFLFDSGHGPVFRISFCGTCSSTLWKESDAEGFDEYVIVQAGTLAQDMDGYRPDGEIFTRDRSKWVKPRDEARQVEGTDVGCEKV